MQINNISKCCKPRKFTSFSGNDGSKKNNNKVRYKHFEQISDEALAMRSITKAYNQVENSGKMRLFKAIPEITTVIAGVGIALTQPGKLSAKAASGLGFLALTAVSSKLLTKLPKDENDDKFANSLVKTMGVVAGVGAAALGACAVLKNAKNVKFLKPAADFLSSEAVKLKQEVNDSRLSAFVQKHVEPVIQKYPNATKNLGLAGVVGSCLGGIIAQNELAQSLSDDIKIQSCKNFVKGKLIQQKAKEHFDSIDAIEVK